MSVFNSVKTKFSQLILLLLILASTLTVKVGLCEPPGSSGQGCNGVVWYPGDITSDGSWWSEGFLWRIIETYIGNCQERATWYKNGQWYQEFIQPAACGDGCEHVYHQDQLADTAFAIAISINALTPISTITGMPFYPVDSMMMIGLLDSFSIAVSTGPVRALQTVRIPTGSLREGKPYAIVGYARGGAHGFGSFIMKNARPVTLPYHISLNRVGDTPVLRYVTYIGGSKQRIIVCWGSRRLQIVDGHTTVDLTKSGTGDRCQLPIWPLENKQDVDFRPAAQQPTPGFPTTGLLPTGNSAGSISNGWVGKCGNLLFYVTDDGEVYSASGVDYGSLYCDGSTKELEIVPVPGQERRFYLIYYAWDNLVYSIVDLDINNGVGGIDPNYWWMDLGYTGTGLAVSRQINNNGDRYLYFTTPTQIMRLTISSTIAPNSATVIVNGTMGLGWRYSCSELELCNAGRLLAGTIRMWDNPHTPEMNEVFVIGLDANGNWDNTTTLHFFVHPVNGLPYFVVSGLSFTSTTPPLLLMSVVDPMTAANPLRGIYWTELTGTALVPTSNRIDGTEDYCYSQLQLAYPGDRYIYAASANGIAGIDFTSLQLDPTTVISGLSFPTSSLPLFQSGYIHYLLPDQIDGEMYDWGKDIPADLWMKDSPEDIGNEPNMETGVVMWESQDIWVADPSAYPPRTPLATTTSSHHYAIYPLEHVSDAVYPNTKFLDLYVMVRNRGCQTTTSGTTYPQLMLYWADATTGAQNDWPGNWHLISSTPIPPLDPGECWDFKVSSWPSPSGTIGHFCFQAQIYDAPNVPSLLPNSSTVDNTLNYNNIAWHNVGVQGSKGGKYRFFARQAREGRPEMILRFIELKRDGTVWNDSNVVVDLGKEFYQLWASEQLADGVKPVGGTRVRLTRPQSCLRINNVPLGSNYAIQLDLPNRGPDILRVVQGTDALGYIGGVTVMRYDEAYKQQRELQRQKFQERQQFLKSKYGKR